MLKNLDRYDINNGFCLISHCFAQLFDIGTLDHRPKDITQLRERNSRHLIAFHTRNIAVADPVFDEYDVVSALVGLARSGRDAHMRHVPRQNNLLDTQSLECLMQLRLLESPRELLPDRLLTVLCLH
jgi:hypothetical protein